MIVSFGSFKTAILAIKHWAMDVFFDSTADWEQNDSTQLNYVKNRPFYDDRNVGGELKQIDTKYIPDEVTEELRDSVDSLRSTDKELQDSITSLDKELQDSITSLDDTKMDKNNPTGSGALSINRWSTGDSGKYSAAIGFGNKATAYCQYVLGEYNAEESNYMLISEDDTSIVSSTNVYLTSSEYTFDETTRELTLINPIEVSGDSIEVGNYYTTTFNPKKIYLLVTKDENPEETNIIVDGVQQYKYTNDVVVYHAVDTVNNRGKYVGIIGNGTSDDARSNAHTLDWDGNAWFAGDVFVGGTDQNDEVAEKLLKTSDISYATEDDILAMLAETGAPMGVADADGSVFTDENGNILIM